MNFGIETAASEQRLPKPADDNSLGFGKICSDHMFKMRCTSDGGWARPTVSPFANLDFSPASLVLDYGQSIVEGLKAYRKAPGAGGGTPRHASSRPAGPARYRSDRTAAAPCATRPSLKGLLARDDLGGENGAGGARRRPRSLGDRSAVRPQER